MKWLQISNLHLGYTGYDAELKRYDLVNFVKHGEPIDFILISGDCMHCNKGEEYIDYISELSQACNCPKENIFICSGNHDININRRNAILFEFDGDKQQYEALSTFGYEKFKMIFKKITGEDYVPYQVTERHIGKEKFRVVTVDSCLFLSDKMGSPNNLSIIWAELKKITYQIKNDDYINILIMHHGLECFEPECRELLEKWIRNNHIDLVFCGHRISKNVNIKSKDQNHVPQFYSGLVDIASDFWICDYEAGSSVVEMNLYSYNRDKRSFELRNGDSYHCPIIRKSESASVFGENTKADLNQKKEYKEFNNNKIFIAHGQDEEAMQTVARILERNDLVVISLNEQADGGKTIIENIERYTDVAYAIVIYPSCDIGCDDYEKREAFKLVVFEYGYLIGKLGRDRVCALSKQKKQNMVGMECKLMDPKGAWQTEILKEMKKAGIEVDANKIL